MKTIPLWPAAYRNRRTGGARLWLILGLSVLLLLGLAWRLGPRLIQRLAVASWRRDAGLSWHKVNVGDHEIAYLEGGRGETVVLLHGFGADKDNWTHFAGHLTANYHVVAPDLPGFGESTYVAGASYRMADQAQRVKAFAEALGLDRFHIAGNSMGGEIAGRFAVMFPGKVLSLTLVDCTGVSSPVPSDMVVRASKGEPLPLVVGSVEDFDRRMQFLFVQEPKIPGLIKRVLAEEERARQKTNETILAQIIPELDDLEPDLGQIKAPTLVLWGDHDRMRDVSSVQVLQKGIPGVKTVIFRDCGHVPMSERPEETAGQFLGFVAGLKAAGR